MKIKEKELIIKNAKLNRKLRSKDLLNDKMVGQEEDEETGGQDFDEDKKVEDMQTGVNKCSWPDCPFSANLTTEVCQKCGISFLHHPCQMEWEHKQGLDNQELRKLCYPCAKTCVFEL
jgi:hypothetical protein